MASADRIHLNLEQGREFIKFLYKHKRRIYKKTLYRHPVDFWYGVIGDNETAFNFPEEINIYLIKNCKLPYIQQRLKEQYGCETHLTLRGTLTYNQLKRGKYRKRNLKEFMWGSKFEVKFNSPKVQNFIRNNNHE